MKKKLPFVKWFIKKNNVKYQNTPRIVATSHRGDRAFLGKNVISTTQNA